MNDVRRIDWKDLAAGIPLATQKTHRFVLSKEVVPIIVIPGISGSALAHRQVGGRPFPGWPINQPGRLLRLVLFGARRKYRNLVGNGRYDPDLLEVIGANNVDADDHGLSGVGQLVYKRLIEQLLWLDDRHRDTTPAETSASGCFRTPPHCFGYNWTQPLEASAAALTNFIDALLHKYRADGSRCDRVVLVAHSTGGLVARWACGEASVARKILGMIHAGVPHQGAPEIYHRFKTGFPRGTLVDTLIAWLAARNGSEGTALLGNLPGATALLPFSRFRPADGDPAWLMIRDSDGRELRRPQASSYREVYREQALWGLANARTLNPTLPGSANPSVAQFEALVDAAQHLHEQLEGRHHPSSVNLVSTGLPTAERVELRASDDPAQIRRIEALGGRDDVRDYGRFEAVGKVETTDTKKWAVVLQPRHGDGDGTVPTSSATQPGVRTIFVEKVPHADLLNDRRTHAIIIREIDRMLADVLRQPAESTTPSPTEPNVDDRTTGDHLA